jgi:hypothetical protein
MKIKFKGNIFFWKGPSPWFFVTVPEKQSNEIKAISGLVTYGWGMIPVLVKIGKTAWKTSLWPKDGKYIVPINTAVRKAENLEKDDEVTILLEIN